MRTAGNIQGVVFDLDGVLIHSTATHASAFQEVLSEFGIGDFDYTHYAGWRTPEVIMAEFRRCDLSISPEIIHAAAARKTLLARRKLAETNPVDADCLGGAREPFAVVPARFGEFRFGRQRAVVSGIE